MFVHAIGHRSETGHLLNLVQRCHLVTMPIKPNRPILRTRECSPLTAHPTCRRGQKYRIESKPCRKIHVLACVHLTASTGFSFFFFFSFRLFPAFAFLFSLYLFRLSPLVSTYIFSLSSCYCPFNLFPPTPLVFRFYSFLFHSFTLFVFVLTLCLAFFQIPLPLSLRRRPPVIVLKSFSTNSDNDMEDPV